MWRSRWRRRRRCLSSLLRIENGVSRRATFLPSFTIKRKQLSIISVIAFSTEHQQSARILLEPNRVSITADNGVVVGTLTTVTQNPEETFSYTLVDEAGIPFQIVGNKLVVLGKNGLDVRVSGGVEALIPITITSKGSLSSSFTESFYVTIVGE